MKQYNIYYMQRSGSHGVINWLCHCFVNTYDTGIYLYNVSKQIDYGQAPSTKRLLVHENTIPSQKSNIIVILRDPFNWAASVRHCDLQWKKKIQTSRKNFPLGITITPEVKKGLGCKRTADLYVGIANKIEQYPTILFNEWFSSKRYRKQVCKDFELKYTDKGLNDVPFFGGGGSSFDGMNFEHEARKMDVLNRWKEYKDDSVYLNFFKENPKLVEVSEQIFDFNPL